MSLLFSWLYLKSMHSLLYVTLFLGEAALKDARLWLSFVGGWLGSLLTTLGCVRRSRRLHDKAPPARFTSSSLPQTMLGSGREEGGYAMPLTGTSSTLAPRSAKNALELIASVSQGSCFVRTASQLMFLSANGASFDSQPVSWFWGGGGPLSFHLIFCYIMVKIYLAKLYTIGKLSSSSICRYLYFKIWVFSREFFL